MAGYHEHFVRKASGAQRRHLSDDALLVHIKAIHAETRGGYLRDVLGRIHAHPSHRLDELLPHRWRPS